MVDFVSRKSTYVLDNRPSGSIETLTSASPVYRILRVLIENSVNDIVDMFWGIRYGSGRLGVTLYVVLRFALYFPLLLDLAGSRRRDEQNRPFPTRHTYNMLHVFLVVETSEAAFTDPGQLTSWTAHIYGNTHFRYGMLMLSSDTLITIGYQNPVFSNPP